MFYDRNDRYNNPNNTNIPYDRQQPNNNYDRPHSHQHHQQQHQQQQQSINYQGYNRSNKVFVGNIPYGISEEQLSSIFCEVGPVVSFKLVFDRETGRSKGYGFCEYQDPETAQSAIRNLNNYDLDGRTLRVTSAEKDANQQGQPTGPSGSALSSSSGHRDRDSGYPMDGYRGNDYPSSHHPHPQHQGQRPNDYVNRRPDQQHQQQQGPSSRGQRPMPTSTNSSNPNQPYSNSNVLDKHFNAAALRQGSSTGISSSTGITPPSVPSAEVIKRTVASLPMTEILAILQQLKGEAQSRKEYTQQLLCTNPQLAYALFQVMLVSRLIDVNVVQKLIASFAPVATAAPPSGNSTVASPTSNNSMDTTGMSSNNSSSSHHSSMSPLLTNINHSL